MLFAEEQDLLHLRFGLATTQSLQRHVSHTLSSWDAMVLNVEHAMSCDSVQPQIDTTDDVSYRLKSW